MGALVTFTDLESPRAHQHAVAGLGAPWPNLGRHYSRGRARSEEPTELHAAVGWMENLKASLPEGDTMPQTAVRVLDNEIDRLDTVVKRFLDFTRPPELHQGRKETRSQGITRGRACGGQAADGPVEW